MIISVSGGGGGGGNDNMLLEIGPKQEDGKDDRYILHEDTKKKFKQTFQMTFLYKSFTTQSIHFSITCTQHWSQWTWSTK